MQNNPKKKNVFRTAAEKLLKNKLATAALIFLCAEILVVILAPVIAPCDPYKANMMQRLAPPFWQKMSPAGVMYAEGHLLGTDNLGRDILSRILYGGRVSLLVGFTATALGLLAGVVLGLLAGYYKKLDSPIMRFMDLLFTFPGVLLALLIVAMMGISTRNAIIAISVWAVPNFARMVRSKVLSIKEEDYIMAIKSLGATDARVIFCHILPNCLPIIIVTSTMRIANSIMSIATLSYLGLGVPAPQPEWGGMIATAKDFMWDAPTMIVIPGVVVMLTVICFNILGDKLRDILDPGLKDA